MSLQYNALNINGTSTSSFPFLVIVEVNAAPTMAKSKSIFTDIPLASGRVKQTINAHEIVEKKYDIYLHHVNMDQVRQFKKILKDEGWFTSYDDPNIKRYYDEVRFESETLSAIDGYHIHVTFYCDAYEYEPEVTKNLTGVSTLNNHTNAPMFPKITLTVTGTEDKWIRINGTQMTFKINEPGTIVIECKDRKQNVTFVRNAGGTITINSKTIGGFPIILPGNNSIAKSSNVTKLEMLCRWGWR